MALKVKILLFIATFSISEICAQNVEFKLKNFPEKKKEFKILRKTLLEGEKYFNQALTQCAVLEESNKEEIEKYCPQARITFNKSLKYFLVANEFNPNNAKLNFKIGICNMYSSTKEKALPYFKKALELDNLVDPQIHYFIARIYHINHDFKKATYEYETYRNSLTSKTFAKENSKIDKKINECIHARNLIKTPERVFVENLGKRINSPFPEYASCISTKESFMLFTSRRERIYDNNLDPYDNLFYEDIYISYYQNKEWSSPKPLFSQKAKGHLSTIGLSPDGKQLLIYVGNKGNGDILVSNFIANEWQKPKNIPGKINTKAHESSASFSKNSDSLYFVSDMKKGIGGRDIYLSTKSENGKWNKPVNLGPIINTEHNEESVFFHSDRKTLYFSSQGHNSIGGYDIFKSVYKNGKWSTPQNLGYPINSTEDDLFFSLDETSAQAYFTSSREGGFGEKDLYMVIFLGPEKPLKLSMQSNFLFNETNPVRKELIKKEIKLDIQLKGKVTNDAYSAPISAILELWDNAKNQLISTSRSNMTTGYYSFSIISELNYELVVTSKGYLTHSEIFMVTESANYFEIIKDIKLKKAKVGTKILLKNIFFDVNKATLKPESYPELDRLAKLLVETPGIIIEISGHTDNKGSDKYNIKLSEKRAKSVVEYLINVKNIDKSRINYKGYGESQPVATNDTEEGRQQNRRTEFKILKVIKE